MKLFFAPVQGHTDAAYRHFHALKYASEGVVYTTPFIRLEKGEIRKKDLRDALSPLNEAHEVVPQVIFKDAAELDSLVNLLYAEGVRKIDINMGCPFPLQTARGRGAASIVNPDCVSAVRQTVESHCDVAFSVKMRLGYREEEWRPLLSVLNTIKLSHVAVHPRTASDQYTGALHMDAFDSIYAESVNPLVYNGDILLPSDAHRIMEKYPELHGIMIGRGVLGRPSLIEEISTGEELEDSVRLHRMLDFHRALLEYYKSSLIGGDHQVLSKISPFWEYAESEIGRKAWKALKKASSMAKYQTALALINNQAH